jgi:hypothetical protein
MSWFRINPYNKQDRPENQMGRIEHSRENEPQVGEAEAEPNRMSTIELDPALSADLRTATQLYDAIRASDQKSLEELIANGINVNMYDPTRSLTSTLDIALANKHDEITCMLLKAGANYSSCGRNGFGFVSKALESETFEAAKFVLKQICKVIFSHFDILKKILVRC